MSESNFICISTLVCPCVSLKRTAMPAWEIRVRFCANSLKPPNSFPKLTLPRQPLCYSSITKTRLYSFDPLKLHFYMIKLGFTSFLISAQKHRLWYSLEPPLRGGSNEYHNLCLEQKYEKYQIFFLSENFQYLVVKLLVYLYGRVFVMSLFFVSTLAVLNVACVLSLIVSYLFFLLCPGKVVFRDSSIFWGFSCLFLCPF